jgi:hypothetical protein
VGPLFVLPIFRRAPMKTNRLPSLLDGFGSRRWIPAILVAGMASLPAMVSGQELQTAVLSLAGLDGEKPVVVDSVLPGTGLQIVQLSEQGLEVHGLKPDRSGFVKAGTFSLDGKRGILGFARPQSDSVRIPLLVDADGLWKLSLNGPAESLLRRSYAVPPLQSSAFSLLGLDLDSDGVDEICLPETGGMTLFTGIWNARPEAIKLPQRMRSQRALLESDQGQVNTVVPPMRRLDAGRYSGADIAAQLPASGNSPAVLVLSTPYDQGGRIRYEVFFMRSAQDIAQRPAQTIGLPNDPRAEDLPVRNADGRVRVLRTIGNLDLLQPRTEVSLHDENQIVGQWATRDPIGLGLTASLAAGAPPSLVLANLDLQAGSAPDMAGMIAGKPLSYRLVFYPPTADGKGWNSAAESGPELKIIVDPSQPRTEMPFALRDATGDGLADLVARIAPGQVSVHIATGPGKFPGNSNLTLDVPEDSILDFFDMDGDGADDVVVSSRSRKEIRVHFVSSGTKPSLIRRLNPRRILR